MEGMNNSTEFIFLGLTQNVKFQKFSFAVLLVVYLVTLAGNLFIMMAINTNRTLGSPVHFFLSYLSLTDGLCSSSMSPQMLADTLAVRKTISLRGCMTQVFAEHLYGATEIILLIVIAFDHYVAIYKPALHNHYEPKVCGFHMGVALARGFVQATIQILFTVWLPFSGPNIIDHFMYDLNPLLTLGLHGYSHPWSLCCCQQWVHMCDKLLPFDGFLYGHPVHFEISQLGREMQTPFHLYLSYNCGYLILYALHICVSSPLTKLLLFYTMITPMLNSLIFTLRNVDVRNAWRKLWDQMMILIEIYSRQHKNDFVH